MDRLHPAPLPRVGLGMASLVLGTIGLCLFFLPILSIPVSLAGVVLGLAGVAASLMGWSPGLRWSVLGLVGSLLVLTINFAIAFSAAGYIQERPTVFTSESIPGRPYVPPPARPAWWPEGTSRGAS